MGLDATLTQAGIRSWVYDPVRDQIYIAKADGQVAVWSVGGSQSYLAPYVIGGAPADAAMDITPDGRFLIIGDARATPIGNGESSVAIYRVNLDTFGVETFSMKVGGHEGGVAQIAVAADNRVLITTDSSVSGLNNVFRSFMASDASPTFTPVPNLNGVPRHSYLFASEDRRYVYIAQADGSGGGMAVYDAAAGRVTATSSLGAQGVPAFHRGGGDASGAGGLVLAVADQTVFAFDTLLRPVKNLSGSLSATLNTYISGEFSENGRQVFLWDVFNRKIVVLDVASWTQVASLDGPTAHDNPPDFQRFGKMDLISGGRVLVLDDDASLKLIDLASALHIRLTGTSGNDLLYGAVGADDLSGGDGDDTAFAGAGDDVISGGAGRNYLRGEDGADRVTGGSGFDDINGNTGDDTASGGGGDDWVVGGKDQDSLSGDAGADLVYGNLGNDTCDGGDGNDIVRGGQGDDVVRGGAGDDFVSGDRGSDTMAGGSGADIFHSFGDAGLDRVLDFSAAEGDRVQLDPGTTYTVSQSGADTVIDMSGGGQMVLVGVAMESLKPGWIFVA